jgi:hypothetical protein
MANERIPDHLSQKLKKLHGKTLRHQKPHAAFAQPLYLYLPIREKSAIFGGSTLSLMLLLLR